jgi:urease accessory protein UreH
MQARQSGNQLPNYPIIQLPDSRPPSAIGREARMELAFENRRGRTILARAYVEPPFRVARAFELDDAAYVIVVCAGPGVFAGDALRQIVHVAPGARAVLTSQSALQAHPSLAAAPASIHHDYHVDDDAELHCHWDPLIPFAGARIDQRMHLHLADTGALYWSDALMAGRVAHGEAWCFSELAHELTLHVASKLQYLERYRVQPADRDPSLRWMASEARYLGTTIVRASSATAGTADVLQRELSALRGVAGGIDMVEPRLIVARLAAVLGPPFAAARNAIRRRTLELIFNRARLVGRK